jgi:uncharacterized protein YggE
MFSQKLKTSFICLLLAISSSCWAGAPFFPKLVVSGTALIHKPADQLGLSIGVTTQADSAEKALSDNNDRMHQVISSLQLAGLEKGEYSTDQFSIQPIYSTPPRNVPQDWKAQIIAYEVTNNIHVKTQKLELAPVVIDAAGGAGATQIANISFAIKDPSNHRSEAISLATANAIKDAEALANAANIQLVRILDIKLDQPQIYPRPGPNMLYKVRESAPFIEAPDVDITANVSVTFEIASKS